MVQLIFVKIIIMNIQLLLVARFIFCKNPKANGKILWCFCGSAYWTGSWDKLLCRCRLCIKKHRHSGLLTRCWNTANVFMFPLFFLLRGFPAINYLLVTGEKKLITEIYSEESFPTCSYLQTDTKTQQHFHWELSFKQC